MFITFEGPEGSGKSTALRALAEHLQSRGIEVVCTREPGGGTLGPRVRELLLHGGDLDPRAEIFLFLADRSQHGVEVIRPALAAGKVVLCDRYADSTVVYQGHARGFDVEQLRAWNALATGGLVPDLTLLFDLEPEAGLARIAHKDRLDAEPLAFHQRVRAGFLREAASEPERWVILSADQTPEVVAQHTIEAVELRRLSRQG